MIRFRGMHLELRPYADYAIQLADAYGLNPVVTSVLRTWEDQARLRRDYEAGRSRFPANRPGDSAHQYGLAWDSWVPEEQEQLWTQIREYVGWRVPPNDWVHAEYPNWRTVVHAAN